MLLSVKKLSKKALTFSLIIILSLIIGLRPIGIDNDSLNYEYMYYAGVGKLGLSAEPIFSLLMYISNNIMGLDFQIFLLIIAFLSVLIKIKSLIRLSPRPIIAIYAYICLFVILHEMTQIRVGLALAVVLLSIEDILKRNKSSFYIKITIATMIHYSAFIFIFLYFLKTDKINKYFYTVLPLFGLIFGVLFEELLLLIPKDTDFTVLYKLYLYSINQEMAEEKFKLLIFAPVSIIMFSLFLFLMYFKKLKDKLLILSLKMYSFQVFFSVLFMFNVEISNRLYTAFGFFSMLFILSYTVRFFKYNIVIIFFLFLFLTRQLIVMSANMLQF